MKTSILATAIALSDPDLLARLQTLARTERETTAELIAHLTALELRPSLYLADGYGSLFDYCVRALGLSEDAACSRINVVRAGMRFPVILDHLFSGTLTLTSVRLLAPHLSAENHEAVLIRAGGMRKEGIEALVAELAPRPDVPASVRKLPGPKAPASTPTAPLWMAPSANEPPRVTDVPSPVMTQAPSPDSPQAPESPRARPIVRALAPQRYRVQFTIGQGAHDDLRAVQALLRREVPSGDPGAIFERALALLRREVEKAKLGMGPKPRRPRVSPNGSSYKNRIRPRTDDPNGQGVSAPVLYERALVRHERPASRHIASAVKRVVWYRDRGQCAFVSAAGRRCAERTYLELHHIQPYAMDGPATVGNIALRCRRHNQYEGELIFGPRESGKAAGPT